MYTNTIVGSYNAIANSEHAMFVMKPPIRRQPKKATSKEGHAPTTRGNSEESPVAPNSQQSGTNSVNSVISPSSIQSSISITSPTTGLGHGHNTIQQPSLPGLEILANVMKILVIPDKIFSPEVSKIGFTIAVGEVPAKCMSVATPIPDGTTAHGHQHEVKVEEKTKPLLKCIPSEGTSSRSLSLETLEGRSVLQLHTHTPYCCSWYQDLEAKISITNGDPFGTILKTAFGPCKCNRRFVLTCRKDGGIGDENSEKIQFTVETLLSHSELLIKENSEVVAKVETIGMDCRTAYKVTFVKAELSCNLKALFIIFAINLHIAFAEKLNTIFGMCLCCIAGSSVAAWVLCLL